MTSPAIAIYISTILSLALMSSCARHQSQVAELPVSTTEHGSFSQRLLFKQAGQWALSYQAEVKTLVDGKVVLTELPTTMPALSQKFTLITDDGSAACNVVETTDKIKAACPGQTYEIGSIDNRDLMIVAMAQEYTFDVYLPSSSEGQTGQYTKIDPDNREAMSTFAQQRDQAVIGFRLAK